MRLNADSNGYSLVETMISLFLASIIVVSIARFMVNEVAEENAFRRYTEAQEVIKLLSDEVHSFHRNEIMQLCQSVWDTEKESHCPLDGASTVAVDPQKSLLLEFDGQPVSASALGLNGNQFDVLCVQILGCLSRFEGQLIEFKVGISYRGKDIEGVARQSFHRGRL